MQNVNSLINGNRYVNQFSLVVILLFTLLYIFMSIKCAYGLPFNYDDVAIFIDDFKDFFIQREGVKKLQYLFVLRHDTHINFPSRLLNLLIYLFNGKLDLSILTSLSSLSILFFTYYLFKASKVKNYLVFLPAFSMLCVYVIHINSWPTASISPFTILFPFLSFYFANNSRFAFAALFCVLSFITAGNGVLVFPICLFIVIYRFGIKNKKVFFWILFTILFFILNSVFSDKSSSEISAIDINKTHLYITNYLAYFATPLNYLPELFKTHNFRLLFGFLFCILTLIRFSFGILELLRTHLTIVMMFIYLQLSVVAISILRDSPSAPRYEIGVFTLWALLYLLIATIPKKSKFKNTVILIFGLLFFHISVCRCIYNYQRIPYSKQFYLNAYKKLKNDNNLNPRQPQWVRKAIENAESSNLWDDGI